MGNLYIIAYLGKVLIIGKTILNMGKLIVSDQKF